MIDALLEVVTDPFGYSAIICACVALVSFCMMVVGVARSSASRTWAVGLLLAGIAYAAVNIGVFLAVFMVYAFAIFNLAYIISVGFVGPVLMMVALFFVARARKVPGWLSIAGLAGWTGCVAFTHLWVIAAASAGV